MQLAVGSDRQPGEVAAAGVGDLEGRAERAPTVGGRRDLGLELLGSGGGERRPSASRRRHCGGPWGRPPPRCPCSPRSWGRRLAPHRPWSSASCAGCRWTGPGRRAVGCRREGARGTLGRWRRWPGRACRSCRRPGRRTDPQSERYEQLVNGGSRGWAPGRQLRPSSAEMCTEHSRVPRISASTTTSSPRPRVAPIPPVDHVPSRSGRWRPGQARIRRLKVVNPREGGSVSTGGAMGSVLGRWGHRRRNARPTPLLFWAQGRARSVAISKRERGCDWLRGGRARRLRLGSCTPGGVGRALAHAAYSTSPVPALVARIGW